MPTRFRCSSQGQARNVGQLAVGLDPDLLVRRQGLVGAALEGALGDVAGVDGPGTLEPVAKEVAVGLHALAEGRESPHVQHRSQGTATRRALDRGAAIHLGAPP